MRNSRRNEDYMGFDKFANARTVIEEEHRMIHDGFLFYRTYSESDIPDGTSRTSLFRTGAIPPHFKRLTVTASEGPVVITLSEGADVATLGTPLESFNANRVSSTVPLAQFYASDTVFNNIGSPILGGLFIPAGASSNSGVAGSTGAVEELILKPNTDYALDFLNDPAGSGTLDINTTFVWYEIGPDTL